MCHWLGRNITILTITELKWGNIYFPASSFPNLLGKDYFTDLMPCIKVNRR